MRSGTLLKIGAVAAAIVAAVFIAQWLLRPRSFEDCLLKNVKSANSNSGAQIVFRACRDLFPEQKKVVDISTPEAPPGYVLSSDGRQWVPVAHKWDGVKWDPPLSTEVDGDHHLLPVERNPFGQPDTPKRSAIGIEAISHYIGGGIPVGLFWFTISYLAMRGTMRRAVPKRFLGGGYVTAVIACGLVDFTMQTTAKTPSSEMSEFVVYPLIACLVIAAAMYRVADWN